MNFFTKTKFSLIVTLLVVLITNAQVGIGNANPQQALHISGTSSTIRIDGLNSTNNSNNTGAKNQAVYANSDGDLILSSTPEGARMLIDNVGFLTTSEHVQSGTKGEESFQQLYQSAAFTLTQAALVMITYSMPIVVNNFAGTGALTDGKPRLIRNAFALGDGTTPDFSATYGWSGQTYTNRVPTTNNFIVTGAAYNTATEYIMLPAGTHSVHVYGLVFATDGGTLAKTSDAFSVYFGETNTESLKVVALY